MPKLDYRKFTLARIDAFISQIRNLQSKDYPYSASSEALEKILKYIQKESKLLVEKNDLEEIVTPEEAHVNYSTLTIKLFTFQKYLGYISKSADSNNSFETYFLFKRLTESIFGDSSKLIISSEWEYSPINFATCSELKEFVFIGLPISEIDNALIVPLGGHELGHTIWKVDKRCLKDKYFNKIQEQIRNKNYEFIDLNDTELIIYIAENSIKRCNEYFCDFVGIGLFGESYIYAFAYLLAPKFSKAYNSSHPLEDKRVEAMSIALKKYNFNVPENINQLFTVQIDNQGNRLEKYLSVAEEISYELIDSLINDVKSLLEEYNVFYRKPDNFKSLVNELKLGVPVNSAKSMADITNAAWEIYFSSDIWLEIEEEYKKIEFLNNLSIKSFEILEINQLIQKK